MKAQLIKLLFIIFGIAMFNNCSTSNNQNKKNTDSVTNNIKKESKIDTQSLNEKIKQNSNNNNKKDKSMIERNIYIGMSIEEFKKKCPDVVVGEYKPTQSFTKNETIAGMSGDWYFDFSESKLRWYLWDVYTNDINKENFDKNLKAIKEIINIYTQKYGKPTTFNEGNLKYKDPYKQRHYGYDVIKAYWANDKIKFANEFRFMGGKGEYNFLLKIEFHDISYKYF